MLLSHYKLTTTGIQLADVDGSLVTINAADALTLRAYLLRDTAKLQQMADEAALRHTQRIMEEQRKEQQ